MDFTPDQSWAVGKHDLVIDTALGERRREQSRGAFEVDVFERVDKQPGPEFVRLPFEIR